MNLLILLITCVTITQSAYAVVIDQIELVDEGKSPATEQPLYADGLEQLEKAITSGSGKINKDAITIGIKTLISAIEQEENAAEQIISYFKNNELAQMMVIQGYMDPLLQHISCDATAWGVKQLPLSSTEVCATTPLFKPTLAKPFPCLTPKYSSHTIETDRYKTTYRLSPECDNLTRIIEHKKKSNPYADIANIPLDKKNFRAMIIGNTKIIFATSADDQTYHFDIKPITFGESFTSFTINCKEPMKTVHIELCPNETLLLFQAIGHETYVNRIWNTADGAREYVLRTLTSDLKRREVEKIVSKSRWNTDGDKIVSSSCVWPLKKQNMSPETTLKLALRAHWFEKLEKIDWTTINNHNLDLLRRVMNTELPKDTPTKLKESIIKQRKEFLEKNSLKSVVQ